MLDISQPYRPPRPATRIALLFALSLIDYLGLCQSQRFRGSTKFEGDRGASEGEKQEA
jgi:hypothetical protein